MDLKFTDEQNMLRDMTRNLCADHSSVAVVRQLENDPVGLPTALWQQMQQTGLTGIRVPEKFGGMGMGLLDAAVVFEQLGRHLAPGPFSTAPSSAPGPSPKAVPAAPTCWPRSPAGRPSSCRPGSNPMAVSAPAGCS
jgi:alkylation response protein AidB-like acyl-CoA dehydrogenase